jgi:RNA polymerase sigma-70 factor (ECF subfamily)
VRTARRARLAGVVSADFRAAAGRLDEDSATPSRRYRAIDLLRRQQAASPIEDAPAAALVDITAADFVDGTTSARMRKALNDCFSKLTAEQRRCLELAYIDGYSQDQIAGEVDSPLGTVKSWIRRGLASLKRCLDS